MVVVSSPILKNASTVSPNWYCDWYQLANSFPNDSLTDPLGLEVLSIFVLITEPFGNFNQIQFWDISGNRSYHYFNLRCKVTFTFEIEKPLFLIIWSSWDCFLRKMEWLWCSYRALYLLVKPAELVFFAFNQAVCKTELNGDDDENILCKLEGE